MIRTLLLINVLISFASTQLMAKTLNVAVATNFAEPMKVILHNFEQLHPQISTNLVIGSSGKLFAQIQQGAPFDVFLSADQDKPNQLVHLQLAQADSQFTYAKGLLVLWSKQALNLDEHFLNNYKGKFAIANPKFAPYGVAALHVLDHYNNPNIQLISASNVIGAFQYIHSDAVSAGLIAKSSIIHAGIQLEEIWEVDQSLYPEILQDFVIIKASNESEQLSLFLQSKEVQSIIQSFGYQRGSYE